MLDRPSAKGIEAIEPSLPFRRQARQDRRVGPDLLGNHASLTAMIRQFRFGNTTKTTTISGVTASVSRRVIILVAVIIAVPVMMWTITIFIRSYVGPKTPTLHLTLTEPLPPKPQAAQRAPAPLLTDAARTAGDGLASLPDPNSGSLRGPLALPPGGCAASRRLSNRACRDYTERTRRCVGRSGRRHR